MEENKTNNTPAVVTPLDEHMGLDIARSLGKRGIPVFGIDPDTSAAGRVSKYCKLVVSPDPDRSEGDYVQFLIEWGKSQGKKSVLFPVSDETAQICSKERAKLAPYFEYKTPEHSMMNRLASKQGLAETAKEFGIPAPQTATPRDTQDVEAIAQQLSYPVILKPIESKYWHTPEIVLLLRQSAISGRVKVVLCQNPAELIQAYKNIATYDDRVIIQESIPGPDENLSYISFYLNNDSKPLAIFAGRKLRVLPIGFGSASYVRSYRDAELEQNALNLLTAIHYRGLGGIEFKKDVRDGKFKLIEFNTRYGMWDGLGIFCGIDTPYIAYQDTLGKQVEPQAAYRENVIWIDWHRDIRAFSAYHKLGKLTFKNWLKSLQGEKMWAVYNRDDWRPGIVHTYNLFIALVTRLMR